MRHYLLNPGKNDASHYAASHDALGHVLVQLGSADGEQLRLPLTLEQARHFSRRILEAVAQAQADQLLETPVEPKEAQVHAMPFSVEVPSSQPAEKTTSGDGPWTLYTDGGCAPTNPGPCAYGVVCKPPGESEEIHLKGFIGTGTNQVAELTAAIEGLKVTPPGAQVLLVSDSQYVLKGISEWRAGWESRNWRNSKGDPVANQGLWKSLFSLVDARKVTTQWVKGHNGHPQNERADLLASQALVDAGAISCVEDAAPARMMFQGRAAA